MSLRRFRRFHERIYAHRSAATIDMLEALSISNMSGNDRTEAVEALQRRVNAEDENDNVPTIHGPEDYKALVARAKAEALRSR